MPSHDTVKRWEFCWDDDPRACGMKSCAAGPYVLHSDYAALLTTARELHACLGRFTNGDDDAMRVWVEANRALVGGGAGA